MLEFIVTGVQRFTVVQMMTLEPCHFTVWCLLVRKFTDTLLTQMALLQIGKREEVEKLTHHKDKKMKSLFFKKKVLEIGYLTDYYCDVRKLANKGARFLKIFLPPTPNWTQYKVFLESCKEFNVIPVINCFGDRDKVSGARATIKKAVKLRVDKNIIFEFKRDPSHHILGIKNWGAVISLAKQNYDWSQLVIEAGLTDQNLMVNVTEGFAKKPQYCTKTKKTYPAGTQWIARDADSTPGVLNGELNYDTWQPTGIKKPREFIYNFSDINGVFDLDGCVVPSEDVIKGKQHHCMKAGLDHFTRALRSNTINWIACTYNPNRMFDYLELGEEIKKKCDKMYFVGGVVFVDPSVELAHSYKLLYRKYPANYNKFKDEPKPDPEPVKPDPKPEPKPEPKEPVKPDPVSDPIEPIFKKEDSMLERIITAIFGPKTKLRTTMLWLILALVIAIFIAIIK